MSWILDLFNSVAAGGITGLAGTIFTTWIAYKQKQQDNQHEIAMRNLDITEREKESELVVKEIAARTESEIARGELQAFQNSMLMDKASYASSPQSSWVLQAVDVIRGITRPLITWISIGIVWWLCYNIVENLGGINEITHIYGKEVLIKVIDTLLYIAVSSTLWWFGTRATLKKI